MPKLLSILAPLLAACAAVAATEPAASPSKPMSNVPKLEKATYGAGCFWGVEYQYAKIPGVISAVSGYAGGKIDNPTYEDVCSHTSGHAEVIEVTFDPAKVSFKTLTEYFFRMHNPTQVDRQGPDRGDQYRSVIFTHSAEQKQIAESIKNALTAAKVYDQPIATKIQDAPKFWRAEEYHQRHYQLRGTKPYCHLVPFAEEK
jgi:peptide-methionine (S)-S-oxide reductase